MSSFFIKPKYFFGEKALFETKNDLLNKHYKKALVLYGGGSIKKNGSYDDLVKLLNEIKLPFVEFGGIEPNPKAKTVDKAVAFARDNKIDVIFAIGGGSVVDSSKVIGALTSNTNIKSTWDYCLDTSQCVKPSVDIVAIITLAGTASENNAGSVITNEETNEKLGAFTPSAIPTLTVLDPTYTYTVSKWQTASGIFDCFSHLMEQYLGSETFGWTKNFLFAEIKTLITYAKKAVDEPTNYEARANVLFTTTMALNPLADFNCKTDWAVHTVEHAFSGKWDVTHGAGLAFVTPTYLKLRSKKDPWFKEKVVTLGKEVFGVQTFEQTIQFLVDFIKSIYLPTKWTDFQEIKEITAKDAEFLADHSFKFNYAPHLDRAFYKEVVDELVKLR